MFQNVNLGRRGSADVGVDVRGVGAGVQVWADGQALQPAPRRDLRAQEARLQDSLRTGQMYTEVTWIA